VDISDKKQKRVDISDEKQKRVDIRDVLHSVKVNFLLGCQPKIG